MPGKENEFKDNLKVTIDYAKAVGARKIHIMAGKLEKVSLKNWETYENNLKYAANILKDENIVGVIEPINQHSVPNYFLSDFSKGNIFDIYSIYYIFVILIGSIILNFSMQYKLI